MEQGPAARAVGASAARQSGSVRALMTGVVDYAGLFPPAALSMPEAVAEFARAQVGPDAWILGRFVVPAMRLPEFTLARAAPAGPSPPCRLSAIVRDGSAADCDAITTFNAAAPRHDRVDTVERRPQSMDGIDWLAEVFDGAFDVYVEVAAGDDAARWLERVRARGVKAKVRTGGLTAEAFPMPAALLSFLEAAVRLRVPFKATAGLHHAVRGVYRLTYEPGSAEAPMYGYLNVLLATAALQAGLPADTAGRLLLKTDAASLAVDEDEVRWGDVTVPIAALAAARAGHLVSFGSCSFREPVDEQLRALTPPSCLLTPNS